MGEWGLRWKDVAKELTGRSEGSCRNRFESRLR